MEEGQNNTYSLDNVEIFEAGVWNGDRYTEKDIQDIVDAFDETRGSLKPYLKLGHSNNQALLQEDGYPSAGWITSLKRNGKKLLAKIENIPEKIYSIMDKKGYGRVSSEIFWNLNLNGKKYNRALKAVALLGADTPEVHSLDDFINLYTDNFDGELKTYHIIEDNSMDFEKKLAEFEGKIETLSKDNDTLRAENEKLTGYIQEMEYKKRETEIKNYLDGKQKEGFITPAQVENYMKLALGEDVKTYSKDDVNTFELVKGIIDNGKKIVELGDEQSDNIVPETKVHSKQPIEEEDTHEKILRYSKENNVSYEDAFEAIANGGE